MTTRRLTKLLFLGLASAVLLGGGWLILRDHSSIWPLRPVSATDVARTQPRPVPAPAWTPSQLRDLLGAVEQADAEGLRASDYQVEALRAAAGQRSGAAIDALANQTAMALAHDFADGRVRNHHRFNWYIDHNSPGTAELARAIIVARTHGELKEWLVGQLPTAPAYRALREALASTSPDDHGRRDRIRANMERWRWLPRDFGSGDQLYVNLPTYRLDVVEGGQTIATYRAVIGATDMPTPSLSVPVRQVIANPDWIVPQSIVRRSHLKPGASSKYIFVTRPDGTVRVRQKPGPGNALGRVKIVFPARVGFIGLGNMGGGMAANLAKKGHDVRAFDLSQDALDKAKAAGCLPVASATEAADGAEAVVTMLPAGTHVEQVYGQSVFGIASASAILIDCSTIDVATARRVAEAARAKGLTAVDAPVSGGIGAAAAGTLTFMVGGTDTGFDRAEPFLSDMGKAVIHAGPSGAGQAAKICNNMLLGATMVATCEAFLLAQKLGLDPQKFFDISSMSSGQSWSMTTYAPLPGVGPDTPADHDYQGGFATALMLKDLRLAMEAAKDASFAAPMGERATELYEAFAGMGEGGTDFSGIIRMLGKR